MSGSFEWYKTGIAASEIRNRAIYKFAGVSE
jgi:hypothetical protein